MICWRCNYDNEEIPADFLGDFTCGKCEILNSIYPKREDKICSWCGAKVEDLDEICGKCGSKVIASG